MTKCSNPACEEAGRHLCSNCAEAGYCSAACQKAHWAAHKIECKSTTKPEVAGLLQSFKDLSVGQLRNVLKLKMKSFSETKRKAVSLQLENALEKPTLLQLVQSHVDPSEIDSLLSTKPAVSSSGGAGGGSSSSSRNGNADRGGSRGGSSSGGSGGGGGGGGSSSGGSSSSSGQNNRGGAVGGGNQRMPTADEMRTKAREIRKNPDLLRRATPACANMTDAEIIQQADLMEQAANNPAMLNEMVKNSEKLTKMTPEDQKRFMLFQDGLSGKASRDDRWIDATVDTIQKNPDLLKSLFGGGRINAASGGGVTDEQVEGMVDWVAAMDPKLLRLIIKGVLGIGAAYTAVDKYTYGGGMYIGMLLGAILAYLLYLVLAWAARLVYSLGLLAWRTLNNTTSSAPSVPLPVNLASGPAAAATSATAAASTAAVTTAAKTSATATAAAAAAAAAAKQQDLGSMLGGLFGKLTGKKDADQGNKNAAGGGQANEKIDSEF